MTAPDTTAACTPMMATIKVSIAFKKISKTLDAAKPMQLEYAIWKHNPELVSCDISYLDCMVKGSASQ